MADPGVIFKRCGCLDRDTGQRSGKNCPRLGEREHGSWYFRCSTQDLLGRAERIRRGGYPSQAAAAGARDELLAMSREQRTGQCWTVARWLEYWLSTRTRIRPTTKLHYTRDVQRFLIPHLGTINLAELTFRQLNAVFAEIGRTNNRFGATHSACTLQHVRTTLRAALNAAIREGIITDNPARRVELPTRQRPHAQVWTEPRIAEWEATGQHPVVAVWTAAHLSDFLDSVREDRLFALWWLIALRGLRRGEAAGLRWADVDLDGGQLTILRQRTTAGYQAHEGPPKSAASRRVVALDAHTVEVLRQHRRRQQQQHASRTANAKAYLDSGYAFTRPDGAPIHPTYLTQRLRLLVKRAGLPPVRLHRSTHRPTTTPDLSTLDALLPLTSRPR